MQKWILMLSAFLNYLSFAWSIKGIFRKQEEKNILLYNLLKIFSLITYVASINALFFTKYSNWLLTMVLFAIQILTLSLFWYMARIAIKHKLTFAFSKDMPVVLIKRGLYKYVRHPFYAIYLLNYISIAVFTFDLKIIICTFMMMCLYAIAAISEEKKFASSKLAEQYYEYKTTVGMFFPKLYIFKKI